MKFQSLLNKSHLKKYYKIVSPVLSRTLSFLQSISFSKSQSHGITYLPWKLTELTLEMYISKDCEKQLTQTMCFPISLTELSLQFHTLI